MGEHGATITFTDHGGHQQACAIVRRVDGKVALCLSLQRDGDVEATLDRDVVEELIQALQLAAS